jgi:hypothetical protein
VRARGFLVGLLAPWAPASKDAGVRIPSSRIGGDGRLNAQQASDFYKVVSERHRRASTIVTSNRTIDEWIQLPLPTAPDMILPLAAGRRIGVLIFLPFGRTRLWNRVAGRQVPGWAAEFDATTWAQFFLKFVAAHPAVTAITPSTSQARHMADNMGAAMGWLPDEATRRRMSRRLGPGSRVQASMPPGPTHIPQVLHDEGIQRRTSHGSRPRPCRPATGWLSGGRAAQRGSGSHIWIRWKSRPTWPHIPSPSTVNSRSSDGPWPPIPTSSGPRRKADTTPSSHPAGTTRAWEAWATTTGISAYRGFFRNDAAGLYLLHVWLWRSNPSGLFADWNPNVSCRHAAESQDLGAMALSHHGGSCRSGVRAPGRRCLAPPPPPSQPYGHEG